MDGFLIASHLTTILVLFMMTHRLWRNLHFLHVARSMSSSPSEPKHVSVLIPARDEARSITACIESLARQNYPDFEVIVLNDQSTDETGTLLDGLARRYPNVTVLHGSENPPPGWNGKSYACFRLAEQATGDWLLFTDADTQHTSTSIAQGVAQAEALQVDVLSAFPRQITASWSERLAVSFILDFLPLIAVNLTGLWRGDAGQTIANGQYLLARAATYQAIGGHRAISEAIVDDFALAQHMQANGRKIAFVDGTSMVACRMYRNFYEVWQGFSKNIMIALETAAAERRAWWQGLLFAWGYACVFVLPFCYVLLSIHTWLTLFMIGWLFLLRGVVNRRLDRPLLEIVGTPLAAWTVMTFGLGAVLRRKRKLPIRWKGRDYQIAP